MKQFSLYVLNNRISSTLKNSFSIPLWVRAEIAELRENRNGHCYLELIEKDEKSDQVIARMRATIWGSTYKLLKPYFEDRTGHTLSQGIKILVQGTVEFQELYGLSFNIYDIDPNYTLGDLEQQKLQVINKLKDEGVLEMNNELELPLVIQKIAIISSPTAAGYGDFIHQLENNDYGIKFYHKLYPAIMQGENAPKSISDAFEKIFDAIDHFDAVILIRGGGAAADLICFDDYWLCYNITQFPLPILTGIGHERDSTIADVVANSSFKTPTAVAEFLISKAGKTLKTINDYANSLKNIVTYNINNQSHIINNFSIILKSEWKNIINYEKTKLNILSENIPITLKRFIKEEELYLNRRIENAHSLAYKNIKENRRKIDFFQKENEIKNPLNILKRGFSLTTVNGKVLKSIKDINPNEVITTHLQDGTIESKTI